jgi:hypothetical protein
MAVLAQGHRNAGALISTALDRTPPIPGQRRHAGCDYDRTNDLAA